MHKFNYRWTLADAKFTKDKGKVFSCFACGGGSSMGYKLAGFDVIGCNEIDPRMMEAYCTNHNPKYAFLESIQTFKDKEKLPDELYNLNILDGSPPCFEAGTLIMTDKGLAKIEDIKKGDFVLTHKNRFRKVTETMVKNTNSIFVLKVQGLLPTKVTGEHPLYTRHMHRKDSWTPRRFSKPEWKDVKNLSIVRTPNIILEQDYIGIAINNKSILPKFENLHINNDFLYIIGRWFGDGWTRVFENKQPYRIQAKYTIGQSKCKNCDNPTMVHKRHGYGRFYSAYCSVKCRDSFGGKFRKKNRHDFILCCGKHELKDLVGKIKKLGMNFVVSEQRSTYRISISNKELCAFVSQFGKGAKNKRLTNAILDLPVKSLKCFLDGYLDADGHYEIQYDKWSCCSISKELILGIQHCVHKVYKVPTSIAIKDNSKYSNLIEGRMVNTNMAYSIFFFKSNRKQQHGFFENGYLWVPFRKAEEVKENINVYNISVEEDESYTFNNLICHNCSSFSMSGNREKDWGTEKQFREGQAEQVLDTLFFDFIDLAKRLQPKVVIAENVKGLLMGEAKQYVIKIYEEFEKAGYNVQHWLLDASVMGVPQRRERVFFIALRNDLCEQFMYQKDMFTMAPKLNLEFNEPEIPFSEIEDPTDLSIKDDTVISKLWDLVKPGASFSTAHPKGSFFNDYKVRKDVPINTIVADAGHGGWHYSIKRRLNDKEIVLGGSFPMDYDFGKNKAKYLVGMSVPSIMVAHIATEIYDQWLSKLR